MLYICGTVWGIELLKLINVQLFYAKLGFERDSRKLHGVGLTMYRTFIMMQS